MGRTPALIVSLASTSTGRTPQVIYNESARSLYIALLILIVIDALLLFGTAAAGLLLDGREAMMSHFILGLTAACTTCFIHCLVMFYLIGTGKDVRDAVEDHEELFAKYVPLTRALKRRVFPFACLAVASIVLAALLGGEVHSRIIVADGSLRLRGVAGWWVHGSVVAVALLLNGYAFWAEWHAARANRGAIEAINAALAPE